MARTFGGASTDAITSTFTSHGTLRSYSIWIYKTGDGGGGGGRAFDKRVSGAQTELLFTGTSGADSLIKYDRNFSGGVAEWGIIITNNAWNNIILTYDSSSATNDPIFYLNGTATALTLNSNSTGTANTNSDAYVIGNRTNDSARNWAGRLCEFAIWNRIITPSEVKAIGQNKYSPLFFRNNLVYYTKVIGNKSPEPEQVGGTGATVTGTVQVAHPPIIYPNSGGNLPFMNVG